MKVFVVSCNCQYNTTSVFSTRAHAELKMRYLGFIRHERGNECDYSISEVNFNEDVHPPVDADVHPPTNVCTDAECMECGMRDCPHRCEMHYWHDGCGSCDLK
jgi:hypothetical protein